MKYIYYKIREFFISKIDKLKNKIIEKESKDILKQYSLITENNKYIKGSYAIYNPIIIFYNILRLIYGKNGIQMLKVFSIEINTQFENKISIFIQLKRPGILIGKGGRDYDALKEKCEEIFKREVDINIQEVKQDINEPVYFGIEI